MTDPGQTQPGPIRPSPQRTRRSLALAAMALAALVLVAGVAFRLGAAKPAAAPTPAVSPTPVGSTRPSVTEVYQQVGPSVVVIRTADGALGSGVIAAGDGTIVSANHVVADGSAITVTFADGTRSAAVVAAASPENDIVALTPATLPELVVPATIGGAVPDGADVIAIGHPLGLTYSVSTGVVSGLDRTARTDEGRLSGLIQFDASVNPGSSGGPLLDDQGLLVGVVVAIADPGNDDAFAGVAFAVPIGGALGSIGEGEGAGPRK